MAKFPPGTTFEFGAQELRSDDTLRSMVALREEPTFAWARASGALKPEVVDYSLRELSTQSVEAYLLDGIAQPRQQAALQEEEEPFASCFCCS